MSAIEIYLLVAAFLFCLGLFVVITRRNGIMALIGIELIMNAANLNFVAFSRVQPDRIGGQMSALFGIVVAAAEVAIALAIVLNVYKQYRTVHLDEIDSLKE
jgi:NADH:ubiquinone oxidoreductase subunit K